MHYEGVELDTFVVMPNHLHGIIRLVGAGPRARPPLSLPDSIQRFKSLTTARYRKGVDEHGWPALGGRLWQRSYFDRIIRNREELNDIRSYIDNNPLRWSARDRIVR